MSFIFGQIVFLKKQIVLFLMINCRVSDFLLGTEDRLQDNFLPSMSLIRNNYQITAALLFKGRNTACCESF